MPAIFISHSINDRKASGDIKAELTRLGFEHAFLDFDQEAGLIIGENWEKRLYEELTRCHAVLLVLTPSWIASKWCFAEMTQARALGKVILPVLCESVEDRVLRDLQHVDLRDWNAGGLARLQQRLHAISDELARGFKLDPNRPPYPGINAFEREDAAIYFGRDEESRAVIERLDACRRLSSPHFVMIIGASGSGKSSLLKASVLPLLARRRAEWVILPEIRPEKAPIEALAKALAQHVGKAEAWRDWQAKLAGPDAVATVEHFTQDARIGEASRATVLLPIDQFEEVFTTTPASERAAFLKLLQAVFARNLPFMVIATGRSDVLEGLIESSELVGHYEIFSLTAMPPERYSRLIEGPATVAGITVETGLSERIARDVESKEALPLLAYTLALLYRRGGADRTLSLAEYDALGDPARGLNPIQNSIRLAADDAIVRVKASERELAALRDAFVPHLVRVRSDDGKRVRQTARRSDVPQDALRLIGALTEARLLTTRGDDGQGRGALVEVTHESLFKAWPTLDQWLTEEQAFLTDLERMRDAHENWAKAPEAQKSGELLYGLLLSRARDWLLKYPQRFVSREMESLRAFIAASAEVADAERLRAQRNRKRLLVSMAAATALFAAIAGVALRQYTVAKSAERVAEQEKKDANEAREEAERQTRRATAQRQQAQITQSRFLTDLARQHHETGDHSTAILLAMEALPVARRNQPLRPYVPLAESALYQAVTALREQRVLPIALSPDGATISRDTGRVIAATKGGDALLYDAANGTELAKLVDVRLARFSRDSRRVVVVSKRKVQILDPDGKPLRDLDHGDDDGVSAAAISHDGRYVATTTFGGEGRLWDLAGRPEPHMLADTGVLSGDAFSGDGKRLVTISKDGQAQIWELAPDGSPLIVDTLSSPGDEIASAAFLPDGRRIVTVSAASPAKIWDGSARPPVAALNPDDGRVAAISGEWLALVSSDGLLITDGRPDSHRYVLRHSEPVLSATFSPDGELVATGTENGIVRLWRIADEKELATLRGHTGAVRTMMFSPDRRRLLTVSSDKTIRHWDGTWGGQVLQLDGSTERVFQAMFSADSKQIVGAAGTIAINPRANGRTATIWDSDTGARISGKDLDFSIDEIAFADGQRIIARTDGLRILDIATGTVSAVPGRYGRILAVSADRRKIFLGGHSDPWHVWDVMSGQTPFQFHDRGSVFTADFSPDGEYLVTAGDDARVFDTRTGKQVRVFGHNLRIVSAAFSADGTMIATGSDDGTIRIWDAKSFEERTSWKPKPAAASRVTSVAFSPGGDRIVSTADNQARIWDLKTQEEVGLITVTWPTRGAVFSPDGRHIAITSGRSIEVWPAFAGTQDLMMRARELLPRQLTDEQLERFFLNVPATGGTPATEQ